MNEAALLAESLYQEDLYQIPGRIVIILPKPWHLIPEADVTQLTKILAALKLSLASVRILTREKVTLEALAPFSPSKVISFGTPIESVTAAYESVEKNGVKFIVADTLDALDDVKKRNLWQALKAMFGV